MANTQISGLSAAISRELQRFAGSVTEDVDTAADEVAKDLANELKQTSPKLTGDYRKGWAVKKLKGKRIVYNKTDYQLTHLLEKGHAKAGGGRVAPRVHIAPAEEKAVEDFLNRVEQAIRQ